MENKKQEEAAGLIDQLRDAIRGSGRSLYQLAQLTGVDTARLSRFMTGKRGLTQDALDRIFTALRLRIIGETAEANVRENSPPADKSPSPTKKPRRRRGE